MKVKFVLKKVYTCHDCNGTRWVVHPAWRLYWEEHSNKIVTTPEEDYQWFSTNGYHKIPPEEIPRETCEGRGVIEDEFDLMKMFNSLFRS